MNIFFLDRDPILCAQYHCDKHVVKMILESAQLLSTAHRVLDGVPGTEVSPAGRNLKTWIFPDERNDYLYAATHVNHPCAIWCRDFSGNYYWLYNLFVALGREYSLRYKRQHLTIQKLEDALAYAPDKIIWYTEVIDPPQCMPDYCKHEDTVVAYRQYYSLEKSQIAVWAHSEVPYWYQPK